MTTDGGLHILIVDDEPFIRRTVRAMLSRVGCPYAEEAEDGERALSYIEMSKPDLVLCDLEMKPMGGLEFVRRLREHANPALRDLPVIMLTSDADPKSVQTAAKFAISGYLVKPVSPKQLADRVDRIFKGRRIDPSAVVATPRVTRHFS